MLTYGVYPIVKRQLMLIGELARACGVSKDTVRHYDELKLLVAGERQAGSRVYREYDQSNVSRIQMIRAGKSMGFSLAEMQALIHEYDGGQMDDAEVVRLLEERLELVRERIALLRQTEALLQEKLAGYGSVSDKRNVSR